MGAEKRLIDANKFMRETYFQEGIYPHNMLKKEIEAQPAVDAAPVVHGRWIDRPTVKGQVYCSECATLEKATDSNYRSRRCPNCGANMDGDKNVS